MKRILYFSQVLPYPPDAGPKVRSYYTLRYLSRSYHTTLVTFMRRDDPPEAIAHLREFCAEVHALPINRSNWRNLVCLVESLLTGKSFIILRDFLPEMAQLIKKLVANTVYDYIHSDQLWMARYALLAGSICPTSKRILDEHNACYLIVKQLARGEHNLAKKLLLENEWRLLKGYEAMTIDQFDHVVTVSNEDRVVLESLSKRSSNQMTNFSTIPICVDTLKIPPIIPQVGTLNVLHLGTMFWLPNVEGVLWFVREVWPLIQAELPDASFTVVGKNPPNSVMNLNSCNENDSNISRSSDNIRVVGYISDLTPYLTNAEVFIIPLRSGSGMRVKILDAWRWGLPVVSTSIGAEGVGHHDGENILIADSAKDFANAVVRVITEPDLAHRLRVKGRQWVEQHYEWSTVYPAWNAIYPG
jgi:polysaccharide biosynthesis protein PslH